jgi:preprotein translocase subunit SecD
MTIRWERFNIYLLAALAAAAACGCQSTGETNPKKMLSTLRLHLEATRDGPKASERVPIYRDKPVWLYVEKSPFLTEGVVAEASVIEVMGGFALSIRFDRSGAGVLEQFSVVNRGRKIAIFSQFGDKMKDYRWLAAPVISHRISDGVLVFTPDATREEAEEIARGLNNVARKIHTWIDK